MAKNLTTTKIEVIFQDQVQRSNLTKLFLQPVVFEHKKLIYRKISQTISASFDFLKKVMNNKFHNFCEQTKFKLKSRWRFISTKVIKVQHSKLT